MAAGELLLQVIRNPKIDASKIVLSKIRPYDGFAVSNEPFDKTRIKELKGAIDEGIFKKISSVIVISNGKLLVEEYFNGETRNTLHDTRSVGKSFSSTFTGIAIQDGYLTNEEQTLSNFYALKSFDNYSLQKDNTSIRELLTMSSGFDGNDEDGSSPGNEDNMYPTSDWVKFALDLPFKQNAMGEWHYFTAGVVLLGDILNKQVKGGLEKYADQKLFKPLNIVNYKWQYTPQQVPNTAGGIQMNALDFAKYGQLYKAGGVWKNKQVIPKAWVEKSFTKQKPVTGRNNEYYGYLFWNKSFTVNNRSYEAFYCAGNGGNYILIFKELPLVVVITATAYGQPYAHTQVAKMVSRFILPAVITNTDPVNLEKPVQKEYNAIYSGVPWYDDRGKPVSAHGANIVKENGRYYLFGEAHSDTSNAFTGFNCYSSADLYNWKFESIALPLQPSGKLGPNRVGERPKVMKCPATGEYIIYMHVDTLGYVDQYIGYATSKKITGPYAFQGPILFNGKPIKKWDMGTFQDKDGQGYVLNHGGDIYKLNDDYKSINEHTNKAMASGFESPAILQKDSMYYFLGSDLTGWERNDNYYFTSTSLKGPWTRRGFFAPQGTLTWNSQTTFVLRIEGSKETTYMYMGDRWSFPKQASAATYVWQPLTLRGDSISIPEYREAWQINTATGVVTTAVTGKKIIENTNQQMITYTDGWQHRVYDSLSLSSSNVPTAAFSVKFVGRQIGFYGYAREEGGYAQVELSNSSGKIILSSVVDMYCKYQVATLKYLSPLLPKDSYTLRVTVLGENWYWVDKKKNRTGSSGYMVSLDKIVINE